MACTVAHAVAYTVQKQGAFYVVLSLSGRIVFRSLNRQTARDWAEANNPQKD